MFAFLNQYLDTWIHFWLSVFQEYWVPGIFQGQVQAILLSPFFCSPKVKLGPPVVQNIYIDEEMQS